MDFTYDIILVKEEIDIEDNCIIDTDNNYEHLEVNWCIENTVIDSIKEEHDENSFKGLKRYSKQQCSHCSSYFYDRYSLLQHNITHAQVILSRLFECNDCSTSFTQKTLLLNHIVKEHNNRTLSNKKKLQCHICSKFYSYNHWKSHIKEVHGKGGFKCSECKNSFKCLRYLQRHRLKIHYIDIRKHKTNGDVHKIERNITEEAVKCDLCPSVLRNKHALRTHVRNCHGQTVECSICKSKLKSNSYFLAHMKRVHYNDGKDHKCNICGKKFKSPRYVKIHKKNSKLCAMISGQYKMQKKVRYTADDDCVVDVEN